MNSDASVVAQSGIYIGTRVASNIVIDRKANLLGSMWMIALMAIFAIEGAFIKAVSLALPVGQILVIFGLGGAMVFACLAHLNNELRTAVQKFATEVAG